MTGASATPSWIQRLLEPAAYPHPVGPIKLIETHISWVFLTGPFAYKVKKPCKLEFLHLVGKGPGEKHKGDVGFNELDGADRMGIGRRLEELLDQGRSSQRPRHQKTSRWRGRERGAARSISMSLPPRCQSAAP